MSAESWVIVIWLVQGHTMVLNITNKEMFKKMLTDLQNAKTRPCTLFLKNDEGDPESCIDGKCIVGWETQTASQHTKPIIHMPSGDRTNGGRVTPRV